MLDLSLLSILGWNRLYNLVSIVWLIITTTPYTTDKLNLQAKIKQPELIQ